MDTNPATESVSFNSSPPSISFFNCNPEYEYVCYNNCTEDTNEENEPSDPFDMLPYPKDNFMSRVGPCRETFTGGQAERMYYHLNTTYLRDVWYPGYIIKNEMVVDKETKFHKDVDIYPGGRLVIKAEAIMAEGTKITVHQGGQLVVEGGHIRGCGNIDGARSFWSGIKVEGRNLDGYDVEILKNVDDIGSLIEDVNGPAISTGELNIIPNFPPIITNTPNTNNGRVKITDATFKNVESMLLLSSSLPRENGSSIENSIQIGGLKGIQNSNCLSVDVIDNDFISIAEECIVSLNGSFSLIDNDFDANVNDVVLTNFYKGVRSVIISNDFYGPNGGIRSAGSTMDFHDIRANTFHRPESFSFADLDIYMDGANHYWIDQGNYFTGIIGVSSRANGNEIGIVSFNEFSDNYIGVYSYDGNPKFSFSENCFDSRIVDVSIHGSISPEIGGTQGPSANNCFTHKGVWSPNAVRDIGGNPDVFIYYEPDLNGFDCRDAFLAPVSVNRLNIVDGSPAVCESIGGESNRPSDGNDSITESLILMGDFEGAINAISTLNHEENFINTVSIRLIEGNLTEVNKLMDSQLESNENISDFKNVVSIGIDLLFNHDLSEIERNILLNEIEQMSFKSNSVSGFAQALYYRATGQFVENLDMSLIQQHHTLNERNFEGKIKINNTKVAIYPNPTKGVVTIKSRNSIKKLNVYNLLGTMILELENLNSCAILDLNKYEDGIYYIRLMDENGKEHIEKVIKN